MPCEPGVDAVADVDTWKSYNGGRDAEALLRFAGRMMSPPIAAVANADDAAALLGGDTTVGGVAFVCASAAGTADDAADAEPGCAGVYEAAALAMQVASSRRCFLCCCVVFVNARPLSDTPRALALSDASQQKTAGVTKRGVLLLLPRDAGRRDVRPRRDRREDARRLVRLGGARRRRRPAIARAAVRREGAPGTME